MQINTAYIEAELEAAAFRPASTNPPSVGQFECLPKWLNCIPLVAQWLWLSVRYGSVSLPSCANPHITCGGMVGEGKREYFECMGSLAKSKTAKYVTISVNPATSIQYALEKMERADLHFPIVGKPDIGWCGYGVRLIPNSLALTTYIRAFPTGETMHMQEYLPHAGEAGLFYARHPNEQKGRLISITLRYFPQVVGDGIHSIAQLIAQDARLCRVKNNKLHQPNFERAVIPALGEVVRLSTIGSTRTGGLYRDGSEHITKLLEEVVDAIARDMKDTYIARFDVRYESLKLLREGTGFTIMEVNGSGSEAVHAWDPKYSMWESFRIIFAKQRMLFRISDAARRMGHKPIGLRGLAKLHFHQQALIKQYPLSN